MLVIFGIFFSLLFMELKTSFLKFSISKSTENDPKPLIKVFKTQHEWTKRERFRGDLEVDQF